MTSTMCSEKQKEVFAFFSAVLSFEKDINAHTEHVLDEAKIELKTILLKAALDKRIKDIYFQFVEDYANTLKKEDMKT